MTSWPLTGRSPQLEELGQHYRDAGCGGVILHGPAGVGKTRLAEEALRLAERGGRATARAIGHPATSQIPLGALAHLLPDELTRDPGGDDQRFALFHAARTELRRLAGDGRLVLLVDDVDLLDETSVAVLVPLIVSRTVFVVATVRAGRVPAAQLGALERDGHVVRMEIGPLDVTQLGTLLHRALDGPVSSAALDAFARLSGGNLQVLTELVRAARERRVLTQAGGVWQLTGPLPTTAVLDELVAEHLSGVAPDGLAVLELLAECDRFGLADLERRFGAVTLEALEASGLVVAMTEDRRTLLRLAHPLYGEVLRARLPPLRRRRLQAELADMIEANGARRRDDVVKVALWRLGSGGSVAGPHLRRAARLALAGHDPALAIKLLAAADGADLGPAERAELLVEAHSLRGDLADVERIVASVWDDDLDDVRRAQLAKRLADLRFFGDRDLEGALAAHDGARERLRDVEMIAAVEVRQASLLATAGRPVEALRITERIGEVSAPITRVELAGARAVCLLSVGRFDEAVAVARSGAVEHAELRGWMRRGIAQHLMNEAHAFAYSGRYAEARALLEPAAARALASGALGAWVWFEMGLAEVARDTGRGHEAVRRFSAVVDVAPRAGQGAALVWAHVGVAQGHLLLGRCAEAAEALERADTVGDSPVATSIATRERTRAWLDACRGDLLAARQRVRDTIGPVHDDGMFVMEVTLQHDLARLGVPAEAVTRLDELAAEFGGPLAAAHADHARALVRHDVARQQRVVDAYESMDALGLAAEAAAELAELHHGRGEARLATAAVRRSAELAERAGGFRSPVLQRGVGPEPLTPREREVALLAASGTSSREIGDRLGLSTRTVDTHLARVYRKLGVAGRAELSVGLSAALST